ncbi:hypothetical protein NLG97_g1214 [Lecanicillium saksenae]|uniref:Uncharacterized protein n=1 Tax=Lecanicillium saksenae TaxID=468837 RepID=A0ACC1R644_9HYPO|nr:hypothetical protein NLG97_g1214 [Lecanicillium saksenae]
MFDQFSNNSQVLPEAGKRNILITSALPFVNNVPHLGNIIGSVLSADAFARYCRGRGLNTLYIGGTDEYGTATEARALVEQCTPQDLCEKYHKIHADIYKWFNISFDIFGRTTTQLQTDITQDIFLKLQQNGITRDIKWGTAIPLEGYEDKVIYSWFDACIGYVSITAAYTKDWEKWWRNPDDVELFQFIGKDNVVFHSVIFPGSQLGTKDKWTKLGFLSTTDYLTYEGGKFSKSRGIGVFGDSAQKTGVPADVWRYFLLSHRPENGDSEFTWESFIACNNSVLLNNFGNFVNRIVKFVHSRHYNGVIPDWTAFQDESFDPFKTEVDTLLAQYNEAFDAVKLRSSLAIVLQISQQGNAFLQSQKLNNALAELNPQKCAAVVGMAVHLVHLLASLVSPFMPDAANSMISQLRVDLLPIPDTWEMGSIEPGHQIGAPRYLFSRIRPEQADEWRKMFGSDEVEKLKREESLLKSKKIAAAKIKKNPQEGKLEEDAAKLADKLAGTQL